MFEEYVSSASSSSSSSSTASSSSRRGGYRRRDTGQTEFAEFERHAMAAHDDGMDEESAYEPAYGRKRRGSMDDRADAPSKNVAYDYDYIHEHTIQLIMESGGGVADDESVESTHMEGAQEDTCFLCKTLTETVPCAYCRQSTCETCVRQCDQCDEFYCTFCSEINYDTAYETVYCFDCRDDWMHEREHHTSWGDRATRRLGL